MNQILPPLDDPRTRAPGAAAAVGAPAEVSEWQGYRLSSHFQPIYSLTHHRVVGHEALLRASHPATGTVVAPPLLFEQCTDDDARVHLDRVAVMQHLRAHRGGAPQEWLFLNVHPRSIASPLGATLPEVERSLAAHGLRPEQVVIEVLESTLPDDAAFDRRIEALRSLGCLVALDDFGAGHSNFDRVFRLRPEIVKLDRSVVVRAERDAHARRIAAQMVSLLHECGCLVLMEGIETDEGAYVALRCDVDLVQGYHFGLPAPAPAPQRAGLRALQSAWNRFDRQSSSEELAWAAQTSSYRQAIELASVLLAGGAALEDACARFLAQPGAEMCYLLDSGGRQVVPNAFRDGAPHQALESLARFAPLHDTRAARWSRRAYFRSAQAVPNIAQVTRPYMTLQGGRMCFTVSIRFERGGDSLILCGDASVPEAGD